MSECKLSVRIYTGWDHPALIDGVRSSGILRAFGVTMQLLYASVSLSPLEEQSGITRRDRLRCIAFEKIIQRYSRKELSETK